MTDPDKKKILKRIEKIEVFAQAALDEASAVRLLLLESGVSGSSPNRGKGKKAALAVLKNRRSNINRNNEQ